MADIFSIVGSALNAQDSRMGVIASNLANVDSITPAGGVPYRAHEVVFEAGQVADGETGGAPLAALGATDAVDAGDASDTGVTVAGTVLSNAPPKQTYDPSSPFANAKGYVTGSNVSQADQMVDLIDSSNSYSASVAVLQQAARVDQQLISSIQVS